MNTIKTHHNNSSTMPTHIKLHYEIKKELHPGSWCIDLTLFHLKKKH
jgi:hypothetical protein